MYEITRLPNAIDIGYTGETGFRTIEIDMSKWLATMPGGVPSIVHIRPNETLNEAYIANTTFDGTILRWTITMEDLGGVEGVGTMQVWMEEEENNTLLKRGKSALAATQVYGGIDNPNESIPPARTMLLQLLADAASVGTMQDVDVSVTHNQNNVYTLHFKIPKGPKGDQGDPAPSEEVVPAVEAWLEENITNPSNPPLDASLSVPNAAAPANITGGIKSALDRLIREAETSGVDLDVSDDNGNVIVRFMNGHIKTKNFDSSTVVNVAIDTTLSQPGEAADALVTGNAINASKSAYTDESTEIGVDLDVSDIYGNVVLRLQGGHIKTKNFDSSDKRVRLRMEFGAHNGAEWYAPECTVPAYRIAGQQGWEWAWVAGIDFSTDGTMYVIHDDTVDRTTDGSGKLNEMSDEEINALNITQTGAGYNLADFDPSELKIPTFEQVLQQCVRYGMKMVLRVSLFPNRYDTVEAKATWDYFAGLLKAYGVKPEDVSCYLDTGTKAGICRNIIGEDVEISTYLGRNAVAQDYIDFFAQRSITGKRAAIINYRNVTLESVAALHNAGIRVYAYDTTDETTISNCATMGVDIFQNGKTYKLSE